MNKLLGMALTSAALTFAGTAQAAVTLTATVTKVYNSGVPTADLHKTSSPTTSVNNVLLTPQYLTGTLNNGSSSVPVEYFAYCIDIFQTAASGTFNVLSLSDYLGAGSDQTVARIGALISAQGAQTNQKHDAAVQLALWELVNETMTTLDINKITETTQVPKKDWRGNIMRDWRGNIIYETVTTTPKQFWADDVRNGSGVLSSANDYLNASLTGSVTEGLQLYVAQNDKKQDFLFWTIAPPTQAVPEPASWAMMILGFGAVGYTMRGRRRVSAVSFS